MDLNERFKIANILSEFNSGITKSIFSFRNGDSGIYEVYKSANDFRLFVERMVKNGDIPELEKDKSKEG